MKGQSVFTGPWPVARDVEATLSSLAFDQQKAKDLFDKCHRVEVEEKGGATLFVPPVADGPFPLVNRVIRLPDRFGRPGTTMHLIQGRRDDESGKPYVETTLRFSGSAPIVYVDHDKIHLNSVENKIELKVGIDPDVHEEALDEKHRLEDECDSLRVLNDELRHSLFDLSEELGKLEAATHGDTVEQFRERLPLFGEPNAPKIETFSTGAVRSADAVDELWELITPIGLRAVASAYKLEATYLAQLTEPELINEALAATYTFLAGGDVEDLAHAAVFLCECLAESTEVISDEEYDAPYRYDLIPHVALKAVAEALGEGAKKYSAFNWEKGMGADVCLRHGIRHIYLERSGDESEPHLGHAIWNYLAAIHSLTLWPSLNKGKFRRDYCRPPEGLLTPEQEDRLYAS